MVVICKVKVILVFGNPHSTVIVKTNILSLSGVYKKSHFLQLRDKKACGTKKSETTGRI